MRQLDQENIELLMFDYVEGNLSSEEMKEFDRYLKENPQLKEEFRAWQEAFVSEPLPEKVKIEKKLIKKEFNYRKPIIYFIAGFAVATFLFVKFKTNETAITTDDDSIIQKENKIVTDTSTNIYGAQSLIFKRETTRNKTEGNDSAFGISQKLGSENQQSKLNTDSSAIEIKSQIELNEQIVTKSESNLSATNKLEAEPVESGNLLTKSETAALEKESDDHKLENTATGAKRKLSKHEKQQLKRIARAKRKMAERKAQMEFLNGDKPYVVPLNPNNF